MAPLLLDVVEETRHKETVKYIRSSSCQGSAWQRTEYSLARLFAKALLQWTAFSLHFCKVLILISTEVCGFVLLLLWMLP